MSDGWAGWVPEELPASRAARTVAEVLNAPESPRERRERLLVERAEAERAAAGHPSDNRNFIARVVGRPAGRTVEQVLARSAEAGEVREGPSPQDLRRAREVLDVVGLGHCLPGRIDGVFDPNLGALEPRRSREVPADDDGAVLRAESRAIDRRQAAERARTDELIRAAQRRRHPPGEWPAWV